MYVYCSLYMITMHMSCNCFLAIRKHMVLASNTCYINICMMSFEYREKCILAYIFYYDINKDHEI